MHEINRVLIELHLNCSKISCCNLLVLHSVSVFINSEQEALIPYIYNDSNKRPFLKLSEESYKYLQWYHFSFVEPC